MRMLNRRVFRHQLETPQANRRTSSGGFQFLVRSTISGSKYWDPAAGGVYQRARYWTIVVGPYKAVYSTSVTCAARDR